MLKRMKKTISMLCALAVFASVSSIPSYAENTTKLYDINEYIKAVDYSATSKAETDTDYSKFLEGKEAGYLSYCSSRTFEYNCKFSEVPNYVELEIMRTTNLASELCLSLDAESYNAPNKIAVLDKDAVNACTTNTKQTVKLEVDSGCEIKKGEERTLVLKFQTAGFTLYGIKFGREKVRDTKNYISAVDYDSTSIPETGYSQDVNFKASKAAGYLGYCSSQNFAYNCKFSEVPDYVEFDITRTADVQSQLCLSKTNNNSWYADGTRIALLNAETVNSCALNKRTNVRVKIDSKCKLTEGERLTLGLKFEAAGFYLHGFRFIKSKDAFDKLRAADVDVWPATGSIYNDKTDSTSGFKADFQNSLNAGYLDYCQYNTFIYDCYFDKTPDYVEIECDGNATGTIGLGLEGKVAAYSLAKFEKDALNASKGKRKVMVSLTDAQKAKITPGALDRLIMRVDAGGLKIYSIKFSTAKEVFYDKDKSSFCVYGNLAADQESSAKFVAIAAGYQGELLKTAAFGDVADGTMQEIACGVSNPESYDWKVFLWKDLDSLSPIHSYTVYE